MVAKPSAAQLYKIKGTAYDSLGIYPIQYVSVLSTSGKGSVTDSNGHYEIDVTEKDSIWFSYLNKATIKYSVLKITNPLEFDISLQINIPVLREVRVWSRIINWIPCKTGRIMQIFSITRKQKSNRYLHQVLAPVSGFDLDEMINMFRFKQNRSMLGFQRRLLQEERDKFVDHRFSKALVRKLTKLSGKELDDFMIIYRPPYLFALRCPEYEFQKYIKDSLERYKKGLPPVSDLKTEEF